MTRKEIERELFKDQCARSYPTISREDATAYVEAYKPIAEHNYIREATRLYDEVILQYGSVVNNREAGLIITGLMEIAEQAMPDTYYASDSRVQAARKFLGYKRLDQDE